MRAGAVWMAMSEQLEFECELTEEQALLDGTREVLIEGAAQVDDDPVPWLLSLGCRRPKEDAKPLDEGDLSLTAPDGAVLFATLDTGTITEAFSDEVADTATVLNLRFNVSSGEGRYTTALGNVVVRGVLAGNAGQLTVEIAVSSEAS